ncbi:MAG TPA: hypothetical protein VK463_02005 [Desulfomonilaceae bacterium]|nr:hypothetical protein [Desulfomonilaceae bacterium]
MGSKWSFERLKSFRDVPYDELFSKCVQALQVHHLEISRSDESLGIIEAKKPGKWPLKSGQAMFVTVRRDSKVSVIEKLDMGTGLLGLKLSADDMLTDKFFNSLRELVQK